MTIVPKTFGQPKISPEVLLESLFRPMGIGRRLRPHRTL